MTRSSIQPSQSRLCLRSDRVLTVIVGQVTEEWAGSAVHEEPHAEPEEHGLGDAEAEQDTLGGRGPFNVQDESSVIENDDSCSRSV